MDDNLFGKRIQTDRGMATVLLSHNETNYLCLLDQKKGYNGGSMLRPSFMSPSHPFYGRLLYVVNSVVIKDGDSMIDIDGTKWSVDTIKESLKKTHNLDN